MLNLDDLLSIRHPEPPRWSPDGEWLAFLYNVDGVLELSLLPAAGGEVTRLSTAGVAVGAWDWAPDGRLTWVEKQRVMVAKPGGEAALLLDGQGPVGSLKWSPDGCTLGVLRGGKLALLGASQGVPMLRELPTPGHVTAFWWSPNSDRIALLFMEGGQWDAAAVAVDGGQLLWRCQTVEFEHGLAWVGNDRLSLGRTSQDSIRREYAIISLADGTEEVVEREESHKGLKSEVAPVASPQGDAVAYTLIVDGWAHLVLRDFARGTRQVLLPGEHEDYGHAGDRAAFSPDGRYVIFASSKGELQQRHLWRFDRETGEALKLTHEAGTHVNPVVSPDGKQVAFTASGPWRSAEVASMPIDGQGAAPEVNRLTRSMPAAWVPEAITLPQHITFESAEGMQIHADLFLPKGFDPSRRYPALVYIHGGPIRQMRYGWHPMHPYAVFYGYNQYLLHQDYVILSVDYRGGTGYGVNYEQANYLKFAQTELEDCVNGSRYLKALPYVDADRVAIWGLSYGGYMTLAALTKYPDEFALGINIAGVWDFEQWARWIGKRGPGAPNYFVARWGGPKGPENEEVYRHVSPRNFVAGLKAPLLNLHGVEDEAVDFAQLDQIVRDCTEHGKDFAAIYYPDETHMFHKRKTWEDAFRRMDQAFARYLKRPAGSESPSAMI